MDVINSSKFERLFRDHSLQWGFVDWYICEEYKKKYSYMSYNREIGDPCLQTYDFNFQGDESNTGDSVMRIVDLVYWDSNYYKENT